MAHQYWTMQQVAPRDEPPALDTLVDGLNALDALECALQQPDSGVSPGHLHVFLPAFLAKPACWVTQVTRRVLAAIPPSSQMLCASPYLDACLFQYDEKHISPTVRPRALAEVRASATPGLLVCTLQLFFRQAVPAQGIPQLDLPLCVPVNEAMNEVPCWVQVPLKFLMRGRREVVCLKIGGGQFEAPPPGPRPTKQLVTWHLHPVLPFVLGVLQKANAPTQAIIYHHI